MQSPTQTSKAHSRTTVFVTHAAPEDNEFALWISSKLATAGYQVWVDVWRDRLLAAVHFLADGASFVEVPTGNEQFSFASWPLTVEFPVSYDADDPPMPREEDEEGTIIPGPELDDPRDDLEDEYDPEGTL
jgi:hypothetical protein